MGCIMTPKDILDLIQQRPFEPFRLYLSDGAVFEVRHPELAMVGRSTVTVGIPSKDSQEPVYDHLVKCTLVHITRTEPINGTRMSK
jgi:hypothetical protein